MQSKSHCGVCTNVNACECEREAYIVHASAHVCVCECVSEHMFMVQWVRLLWHVHYAKTMRAKAKENVCAYIYIHVYMCVCACDCKY